MLITAQYKRAKSWKQPRCPSTDEWINKLQSVCTMRCYLAIKRNEVVIQATTCRNLGNKMVSERSQSQKATLYDSLYTKNPENENLYTQETNDNGCQGWRGRLRRDCLTGYRASFMKGSDENVWNHMESVVAQHFGILNATELYTLK